MRPSRHFPQLQLSGRSWDKKRRLVTKVEWRPGELYPRVGFIVTKLLRAPQSIVAFYNQRSTFEQYIKEQKSAE